MLNLFFFCFTLDMQLLPMAVTCSPTLATMQVSCGLVVEGEDGAMTTRSISAMVGDVQTLWARTRAMF